MTTTANLKLTPTLQPDKLKYFKESLLRGQVSEIARELGMYPTSIYPLLNSKRAIQLTENNIKVFKKIVETIENNYKILEHDN